MREARASAPRTKPRLVTRVKRAGTDGSPIVTYSIIAITAVVFLLQLVSRGAVTNLLSYYPVLTVIEPWRMLTSIFVHSDGSFFHIIFNMLALFLFGRVIEQAVGRWRFLALYLISGFAGSVAVLVLDPSGGVVGASGAVFGLLGAFFVIQRGFGGTSPQLLILIAINLGLGFILPGISWQAHVGGLIAGVAIGFIFMKTRSPRKKAAQALMLVGVVAALLAITVVRVLTLLA
ncbi:rhomboid family intramembrane serine protease [Marisediminicola sp. LYQ134]|uniref:rhomboid family intramembrane serine protease n=1 Tax=unclassified Marisediminicola TaxID=2618316 RepID=UPI003982F486